MPPRFRLPAEFRAWRAFCLLLSLVLAGVGVWETRFLSGAGSHAEMMAAAMILVGTFVAAAISFGLAVSGVLSRPATGFFGSLFYPEERLGAPPENLLFALRMRLRDRGWEAVDQQTRALLDAYGPSPELYHLRAHLEAGRSGACSAVTVEASAKLSRRAFDRYTELLRRDPPPREAQVGIEA